MPDIHLDYDTGDFFNIYKKKSLDSFLRSVSYDVVEEKDVYAGSKYHVYSLKPERAGSVSVPVHIKITSSSKSKDYSFASKMNDEKFIAKRVEKKHDNRKYYNKPSINIDSLENKYLGNHADGFKIISQGEQLRQS